MANDLGFPDIGLTTLQDVSTRSYLISRVTNLPTIVDIDTGFKSCKETIETFEEFGISAVHLEDQIERKRCGHLDNKELISTQAVSYTHLRAHETDSYLVCRLLLEKKMKILKSLQDLMLKVLKELIK